MAINVEIEYRRLIAWMRERDDRLDVALAPMYPAYSKAQSDFRGAVMKYVDVHGTL